MRIHVCSPQLSHLPFVCRLYHYVKEHRQTPFPFVDDAKVETKKSPQKYWSDLGWIWDGFGKFYIFGRYVFPISSANFSQYSTVCKRRSIILAKLYIIHFQPIIIPMKDKVKSPYRLF